MIFDPYRNTPDEDLVYFGDDEIVWDRINAERLRRGLPGLAAIGIPRPEGEPPDPADGVSSEPGAFPIGNPGSSAIIGQLETRRAQITRSVTLAQNKLASNQRLAARLQNQLAATTDPQQRESLLTQTRELQAVIDSDQRRIEQAGQQLETVTGEITSTLRAAFPNSPTLAALPGLGSLPALPSLPSLDDLPVSVPVNAADVLKAVPATVKIPGLDQSQITGLLSSASQAVSSAATAVGGAVSQVAGAVGSTVSQVAGAVGGAVSGVVASVSAGVGKFGVSPQQLEQQGLLKPGTSKSFLSAPASPTAADIAEAERINAEGGKITAEQVASNRRLNEVLSSPFSWTGKNGVNDLSGFTNNENLQSLTQQNIMSEGLDKLKSLGAVTGAETPEQLGSLVQAAAKFGPEAAKDWSKGAAPPEIAAQINNIAKDAQQAVNLVDKQIPSLGAVPKAIEGKAQTIDRKTVDAAFASLLGDPKISLPSFGGAAAGLDSALSANTKDEDLTYTGDDPIVWDRINAERIRRGLPGLAAIGSPRPPDTPE